MLFERRPILGLRLCIFLVLSVVLMVLDHKKLYTERFRAALTAVVAPIQYVVDWPVEMFDWASSSFTSHRTLVNKNADLRARMLFLHGQIQRIIALEKENKQLRALLQSSSHLGAHFAVAQLLAVNADSSIAQVVLGKGKKEHLFVGQPVLDASGVMGQVVQVGPLTSRVMLITDHKSAIPVQDDRNGIRAIALGNGSGQDLSLINVPNTSDIKVGDLLTTSGLGLRYPVGYPVAVVSQVSHISGQHFARIMAAPRAQLDRSRQVLLVWQEGAAVYSEAKQSLQQVAAKPQKRGASIHEHK